MKNKFFQKHHLLKKDLRSKWTQLDVKLTTSHLTVRFPYFWLVIEKFKIWIFLVGGGDDGGAVEPGSGGLRNGIWYDKNIGSQKLNYFDH